MAAFTEFNAEDFINCFTSGAGTATGTTRVYGAIVSCLVEADNICKENVEHSGRHGFRVRRPINDPSQSAAAFAKATVETSKRYMHEICKSLTGRSNCDVIIGYGDNSSASTTKVMVRYEDQKNEEVYSSKLSFVVQLKENSMPSMVVAEGKNLYFFCRNPEPRNVIC